MCIRHVRANVSRFVRVHYSTIAQTSAQSNRDGTSIDLKISTPNPETTKTSSPIKLSRQEVQKYYTLFKMSEFSPSMTYDDKLAKSLRLWKRKSRKEHNNIHAALENIIDEVVAKKGFIGPEVTPENVSSNDMLEDDEIVDKNQAYKTPKYRYNLTSGTRLLKFTPPSNKIRRYFHYLKFQQYKEQHPQSSLDSVTKSKIIAGANRQWRHVSSLERYIFRIDYENLLYKGMDISQKGEELVTVEVSEGSDLVVHKVLGEAEPRRDIKRGKRIPSIKLILNELTGYVHVYGLTDFHVWNYFLGKEYASRVGEGCDNIGEVIRQIEDNWIEMSTSQKNSIRTEYKNILFRGQDLLYGKLSSIKKKRDIINKPKQYHVVCIRGDSSLFNVQACDVSPSKFTIPQPTKLRFIKNTFVGNTIIVGELDLLHAWNYFVYQQRQLQAKEIDDEQEFHQNLMHQWNEEMNDADKQEYLEGYKSLLVSGYDIYMGEKMTIEMKMNKTGIKNLVVEVWGQPITQGVGRTIKISPLPILVEKETNKVLVLSEVTDVHAYNYYLANQLAVQRGDSDGIADYSKLPQLQQEWLAFTPEQKHTYATEYMQLLNNGQDYAYGKIVPLTEKLKISIYTHPTKLNGKGTKSAFNVESSNKKDVDFDSMYPQAFSYYMYTRKTIDNVGDSQQIANEWTNMPDEEKLEVQDAYGIMVDAGFELVDGVLKDVQAK
ncbi:hypothetical protein FOB58_005359 [Candida parapsilosis]|uniref:Uncharacterized protein n=2 Tax=Candida parapsilosis TaxID=5480 RepID=G8B501_CANPC|nr:uncharacterized protein CPAR2_601130 [Candida parapsilosis]KAF6043644.1 hypothetical protein FOB58_005359 [Candida parapsilosis]KAF6043859.1 hypothetical protein FOB59_004815 [Candida parapsilosis]KAF6045521.1 hypothetical protein FOB60_005093 [Candida parapsilosis]KAF6060308.1 hypothetical protein FOB61_005323 [Candida parapsilosis]KAI5905575.1 hypothetical protein K4G60_g4835 [Candida parapsilosis]